MLWRKVNQGKVIRKDVISNRLLREVFMEKAALKQGTEGGEGGNLVDSWAKTIPGRRNS